MTVAESNAAVSAFYSQVTAKYGHPRPDARPEWDDLTIAEQAAELATGEHPLDVIARYSDEDGARTIYARMRWEALDTLDAIRELRKGPASDFYEAFRGDPHVMAWCRNPECLSIPTAVYADGICQECGYNFTEGGI